MFNLLNNLLWLGRVTAKTRSAAGLRLFRLDRRVERRTPGTFHFSFGLIDYVDAHSLLTLYAEIFFRRIYDVTDLPVTPCIIDCGGNIGMSVVWFKQHYPRANITVFEADPTIAAVLERNVVRLRLTSVDVVCAAVGETTGSVPFIVEETLSGHVGVGSGLTVPAVRLSDYITGTVDLLKVDIEGSEFGVIRDLCASGKIALVRRLICEVHVQAIDQHNVADLWFALSAAGFRLSIGEVERALFLPGSADRIPFPSAKGATYVMHLYAWRPTAS